MVDKSATKSSRLDLWIFGLVSVLVLISVISAVYLSSLSPILIAITIAIQSWVMCYLYKKYSRREARYYFLHPLFILNGVIILRAFIPYFYQAIFGTFNPNLVLSNGNYLLPISVFCSSVIVLNIVLLALDNNISTKVLNSSIHVINKKKSLFIFGFLYALAWLGRIIQLFTGGYYHAIKTAGESELSLAAEGAISAFAYRSIPCVWLAFAVLYFKGFPKSKKFKVFFWGSLIVETLFFLPSGSKLKILYPLMIFIFVWAICTRRRIWQILAVSLAVLIVFMPFYNTYRLYVNKRTLGELGGVSFVDYFSKELQRKGAILLFTSGFAGRADVFRNYLLLTESYPKKYHFLWGRSYLPIFTSWVPRFIFPNKPTQLHANLIGRKAGLIGQNDYVTSPAITPWGEAYINFGYVGVFVLFILLGLFYFFFFRHIIRRVNKLDVIKFSFYGFTLLYLLFRVSSVLLSLFGPMIQVGILVAVLLIVTLAPLKIKSA